MRYLLSIIFVLGLVTIINSQNYHSLGPYSSFPKKKHPPITFIGDKYDRDDIALILLRSIIESPKCDWFNSEQGNNTYEARVNCAYNFADAFLKEVNK